MSSEELTISGSVAMLPPLIAREGNRAALRFLEFFTANIRNPNTPAAYGRAAGAFLRWCEGQGITSLAVVLPVHVAAYIEQLQGKLAAPTVKQHLACIRMMFDWLVTGQVVPSNPAHSVRGPRFSVSKGVTPVLSSEEASALLAGMDVSTVVGLRDRAIIAVMTYSFARVSAVVRLNVEDYYPQKKRWWLRLREKKASSMKCPATTSWKTTWTAMSRRRASPAIGRGLCFAPRSARRKNSRHLR
jgi:site-specific recombinase XerD